MSKIKYLNEIISELSSEFSIPEEEMEELCKNSIKYLHTLVKTPEIISIFLPKLGVLHFNLKRAKYSYNNSNTFRNYIDTIGSQIKLVEDTHIEIKDLVHARTSFYTRFKKKFFKDREYRKRVTKSEVFKKIELKQNKE